MLVLTLPLAYINKHGKDLSLLYEHSNIENQVVSSSDSLRVGLNEISIIFIVST